MKKFLVLLIIPTLFLGSCTNTNDDGGHQDPITPESKITLVNSKSKFYMRRVDDKDTISPLRTFNHKDYGDVPYVDFNEYHYAIRPYIERVRNFYQVDANNYVYSTINESGKMTLNADSDVVSIVNSMSFYLDALGTNNGVDGDITNNNIKNYKSSDKTKILEKGKDVTINLKDYGMDLVSENNHLYVPLNFLNTLVIGPICAGICFNGVDFFSDAAMRNSYTSIFARSGNYNCSWPLTISETPTALKKVANKLNDEVYRFEGIYSGSNKDAEVIVTLSLFNDHKGTMNGSGRSSIHFAFNWSENDDVINLTGAQTFMESRDLEDAISDPFNTMINKRPTNYALGKRSKAVAKIGYDELRLTFDYLYGLKEKLDVTKLITSNEELKNGLLSEDIYAYEDAFTKLINFYIDDIHSSVNGGESFYSPSNELNYITTKNNAYEGTRKNAYYTEIGRLSTLKTASGDNNAYIISGDTAYLKFHLFIHNDSASFPLEGYNSKVYKTESYEEAQNKVLSALNYSPYYAFCAAFNDIMKHENIKNVVIDLTGNIGGEVRVIPYLAAFLTSDPNIVYRNTFDGTLADFHYKVDLNGDGEFGGVGDTFEGKYKFYLLDGANFSGGNEFATMAKNTGFAKILGEKSSGGSCAIYNRVDSTGLTYKLSSPLHLQLKDGDKYVSNDNGVEIDYELPFENWYEVDKLDSFLKTLN